jgi:Flp pilus assembly protein TadD
LSSASALSVLSNKGRRVKWPDGRSPDSRLGDIADVACSPTFSLNPDDKIFTIGSCFARNIEQRLNEIGFDTPMYSPQIHAMRAEVGLDASSLNKYNTATIRHELEWAFGAPMPDEDRILLPLPGGNRHDLFLNQGHKRLSLEQARHARATIGGKYRQAKESRIVVITLGLAEAWFDTESGLHINEMPPLSALRKEPDRFVFDVFSYEDILADLNAIHALLKEHGHPDFKILLTVSPVPLRTTFRDVDVIWANTYSKSVQRSAAEAFAAMHANVNYFPSYEIVTLSDRRTAFESDNRHVQVGLVERIVDRFISEYMPGVQLPTRTTAVAPSVVNDLSDPQSIIATAKFHTRHGEFAEAAECYRRILTDFASWIQPTVEPQLRARYAACLLQIGDAAGAMQQTRQAQDNPHADSSVLLKCAENFLAAGDTLAARAVLEKVEKIEPASAQLRLLRARCSMIEGDLAQASSIFATLLNEQNVPDDVRRRAMRWAEKMPQAGSQLSAVN